jgi:hypothetical protein
MAPRGFAMIELTQEQLGALARNIEQPPVIIDPVTKREYVLLRKEVYESIQGTMVDEDDARLMAPLLADLDPEDWEETSAYEGQP